MKKSNDYIAIIDYQLSNLFSVKHALDSLKVNSVITSDPKVILKAKAAILPGVGAFGDAMNNLKKLNLIDPIKQFIKTEKPFMGVCLGLQLLFSTSFEFGQHQGLNIIKGQVKKFPKLNSQQLLIISPQITWNQIYHQKTNQNNWQSSPLSTLKNHQYMYFVHSYYVQPEDNNLICSYTDYSNFKYCSSLISKNIFAVQFHPEKSGPQGIEIYSNWIYN
jgi:imidazole glycerol-phosphate synthase subunit HisH